MDGRLVVAASEEEDGEGGGGISMRSVISGDSVTLAALRGISRCSGAPAARRAPWRLAAALLWLRRSCSGGGGSSRSEMDLDSGSWLRGGLEEDGAAAVDDVSVGLEASGSDGSARWPTDRGREE